MKTKKMHTIYKIVLLILIVSLAAFLRFYKLDQVPPSLNWDEVAWGYNAYSLGIDGRDEFGKFLPITYLESYGDFKPPLYAYLDIIPVKVFGLTAFATRFPSATFGVLAVFFTYFLTKEIFFHSKQKEWLAIASSGLLAISPWHVNLSRAAFEANVANCLIIVGVVCFLVGVRKYGYLLYFSVILFVLSLYTFNSARAVAPLLFLTLVILTWKQLLIRWRRSMGVVIMGILIIFPLLPFLLSPQASLRFKEVNIFSDIHVVERVNQQIKNDNNAFWSKAIHNRRLAYGVEYLRHYFDNLNLQFLFISGDHNPKFSTQIVGEMYLWELPFLCIGLVVLLKKREEFWWIIPVWLFIGIIPAASARETPHALRIENVLPTFQVLVMYGVVYCFSLLREKPKLTKISLAVFTIVVFSNFLYYIYDYHTMYPAIYSGEWQYGYQDAVAYIDTVKNNYDKIYFTEELGRPYMYTLFYSTYPPEKYRREAIIQRDAFGFVHVKNYRNYYFADDITKLASQGNILYIDTPSHIPQSARIKKAFYLRNGEKVLVAYTKK